MGKNKDLFFYYHEDGKTDTKVEKLQRLAEENGFQIVNDHRDASIIVSIGGDGAFLQTVRKTGFRQDCIYIGMSPEGQSGLYCDFNIDHFDEMLHSLKHDELEVRRFPIIKTKVNEGTTFYCLNELTIRSTIVKTIVIDVHIDDKHFETFRGDGLIVATPTGSTGYTKSAHGAVIDPLIPCYQVSEIASLNNNQYRTLGSSFILDKTRQLKLDIIQDGNDHPIISLDNEALPIRKVQSIEVSMDDKVVKTVKLKNNTYWDRVKRTFL
ncbi:NAD kinase [Oceanobacillus saliphilus]|uniref:NAD kinase n=1 Tax=Oceanobacillus saliphilus TaxID=2925834 RepID=UPI00201E5835|nr:NAD kinase [Oceanobacillus saliphilus]